MTTVEPEKRRDQRLHTARLVFLENATGVTRDVSSSGVFFWTSKSICAAGEIISLSMETKKPEGKMMLKCRGDVVRIERRVNRCGVAVRFTEWALEPW